MFFDTILSTVPLTGRGGATQFRGLLAACARMGERRTAGMIKYILE